MQHSFIKGLDLSEYLYNQAVRPILADNFPTLAYSAALIGPGSDVLGFDTPQSMDHDWGPRLFLFVRSSDYQEYHQEIDNLLRKKLPAEIQGYATNFDFHEDGTTVMKQGRHGEINHRIKTFEIESYFKGILNFDPLGKITPIDWVSVPENSLLMLTSGRVFFDGLGQLNRIRHNLNYYPDDVWLYILAAQWQRISQEEHFMGRCGQVSDELGSRLVAGRLVRDLMRLCFLMEQRYVPYSKWFGSAFSQLDCAAVLMPTFLAVLQAESWVKRQTHLSQAYEQIAKIHNSLRITESISPKVAQFHERPFWVIHAGRFVDAIRKQIKDPEVLRLPKDLGSFDQFVDSTDALEFTDHIKAVYSSANRSNQPKGSLS